MHCISMHAVCIEFFPKWDAGTAPRVAVPLGGSVDHAMSQGHVPSPAVHHGPARGKWEGDGRRGGAPCGGAPWEWARARRQAAGMALSASDRKGDGSRVKRGSRRTQQGAQRRQRGSP